VTQKGRRVRLVAVGSVCVIATMTLWLRLVQVQVLRHDAYSAISQRQIEDPREVKPTRGGIFDREGRPLALSSQMYSVSVSPQKIRNRAAVERVLARTLDLSGEYVRSRVRSSGKFVWLTRQVALSEEERTSLSALGGIEVHREPGRI